jgi:energy-coupling factor transport system ATP-binding protein
VAFGPENVGFEPEDIRCRVDNALKAVDMYEYREKPTHKLSGGQKQRVAIAGIIAMEPECIVLDEPTAMLDPKGRQEVLETIAKLNREKGITIILITHFMEEAAAADRVLVMNEGEIVCDGKPEKVFSQVEAIRNAGLDVPQSTDLLARLAALGYSLDVNCISSSDCAASIEKLIINSTHT